MRSHEAEDFSLTHTVCVRVRHSWATGHASDFPVIKAMGTVQSEKGRGSAPESRSQQPPRGYRRESVAEINDSLL